MRVFGLGLGLGLGLGGCEEALPASDMTLASPDLPPARDFAHGPDAKAGDMLTPIDFEDFVLGLIDTQTADTTLPTTTEDKIFFDSMDPTKFTVLFP